MNDWNSVPAGQPTLPQFQAIWNSFAFDDSPCKLRRSEGMKEMLLLFIYWEYLRDQPIKNNIAGNTINIQANSEQAVSSQTNMYTNYNKALETYWNIQWYIYIYNPNDYDYSKFAGQRKDYLSYI